jgi:Ca-activated chloride channel family protein
LTFARTDLFWLFMILPGMILWAIRGRMQRRRDWQAIAQRGRVPRDGTFLIVGCVACMIIAMAQPRWGRLAASPLPPGHDVVLLVDVSRSMGVEDAVPNRLAAAVEAAESLVNALAREASSRVGVVAFAGRGVVRCPLTENLRAVLDALHKLRPGGVNPGGTDLGRALDAARDALGPERHAEGRAIVVFSDGEDHAEAWSSRLDRLREEDIVVHAVAIGDLDHGHPVPDGKSAEPLRYHGEQVLSQRKDLALESVARRTDGSIVKLGLASGDLGTLYQTKIEPAARRRRESTRLADPAERFPIFLIVALALLIAGCWPARRGWSWPWNWYWSWNWRRSIAKAGVATLLAALAVLATGAEDSSPRVEAVTAAEAVARGKSAYDSRRWDEALAEFQRAIALSPASAVPRYNAAASLYQLGRYGDAHERYLEAGELADRYLRTKIDYAIGNTALAEGDIPGAIRAYDDCIASTARGADLDVVRQDAAINRSFALEQPQSLAAPEDNRSGDGSKSKKPDRKRGSKTPGADDSKSSEGEPESDPGNAGSNGENDTHGDRNRPPASRRRMGGAGGGRTAPPGERGDTPDDRLDAALEHIRAAQSNRIPNEEPPMAANGDRKDW